MDKEEISYQCLTNEQLIDKTAGLLRILEQRLERKLSLCSQTVQNLMLEREKLQTVNSIIDQLQGIVSSGSAQGFVFGLITKNKIWSASSNNLSRWWNKNVNFERNGPRILASETYESLGLDALKDLQDPILSSIISVLMPHCWPAQRSAPFHGETPVAWWPKGTEEWWGRVNILKDSGPPEYKKPHNLRKNAKIAVLIAIIKNIEPNFSKIRSLVSDSETLQSKMKQREKNIWLAVLRGEEIRHSDYHANRLGNSRIESISCCIAGKNVEVENVDGGSVGDRPVNVINSPLCEKGENASENWKKIIAGKKQVIDTESSTSTRSQGLRSKATNVNEPGEVNDKENSKEEFIAHPEQVQVIQKNSPASSQSSLLAKKDRASKSENSKKQKLMGIVNPDPKRLKLPYWNRALRWRSHDIQGPLPGSTGSLDEIVRSKKSNEIMNTGTVAKNIPNKYNNYSGKSSCHHCSQGDYAGMMNDPHQEYLVQTNNFGTNSSKDRTNQSYDSSTSLLDLALIQGQVNTLSSNSLIRHDQSMNHQYTLEKGPLPEGTGSFDEIVRSKKSNEIMNTGTVAKNIPNKYNNYSGKSSCHHYFQGDYAGMMNDPHQEYLAQTNNFGTISSTDRTNQSYDSSTSLLDLALIHGQVNTLSSNSLIRHDQSMNHQYTVEKGSVNIDNQIQHDFQTIYGSPNFTSLSKTDDHPSVESSFRSNTNENNKTETSDFTEPGAVNKSLDSTLMPGSDANMNHEFQTYNGTFNPSSTSANNFVLGKNIPYQPIASYSMPARGQNTAQLNYYSITANQSSPNLNPHLQHHLLLNSAKHGSVYINPQFQDQLNTLSKKPGSRDSKTQLQNQFESGSSYPILESSCSQVTKSERVSNSLISTEQGINYGEDVDSRKNNDVEKTMVIENAMDSDAAAESGLQNFEFDGLAVELDAFCALDSFESNALDGIF